MALRSHLTVGLAFSTLEDRRSRARGRFFSRLNQKLGTGRVEGDVLDGGATLQLVFLSSFFGHELRTRRTRNRDQLLAGHSTQLAG